MPLQNGGYQGPLYRALNPVYAREPLSGYGAARYGGRFNTPGTPALYTALDPTTALREANQAGSLQPTVLVSYRADLGPVFDSRDVQALAPYDMTPALMQAPDWRAAMLDGRPVPTQIFSNALVRDGFAGLLVRSFAKGADADALNIVLWRWTGTACALAVVDDENRLGRIYSFSGNP